MNIEVEEDHSDFLIKLRVDDENGRVRAIDVFGRTHFKLQMRPQTSEHGDDRWTLEALDLERTNVIFRSWQAFASDSHRLREGGGLLGRACSAILEHVGIDERPTLGKQSGLKARIEAADHLLRRLEVDYGGTAFIQSLRPMARRHGYVLRPDLDAMRTHGETVAFREALAACEKEAYQGRTPEMPPAKPFDLEDLKLIAGPSCDVS